ncbi:MAG: hypothetical protein ACFFFK_12870 [Candidatus Thorarchaeota archaeon]
MMKHATLNKMILGMFLFLLVSSIVSVNATTTTDDQTTNGEDDTTTDDGTDTSTSSQDDHSNDREVTVDATPTHVEIQSQLESGGVEDSFKISVQVGSNGAEFQIEFESETATNETERQFEVRFDELIEYLDVNDNGVYDDSVDTDVKTLMLDSFEPIAYSVENTADGPLHVIDVLTTDGIFGARVYAVGDFTDVNGTVIAPTQVKIDVFIRNFNFTETTSFLALKVELGSELETSFDDMTEDEEDGRAVDESAVDFLLTDVTGFFSWKDTAEIDGVTHMVNSSIDEVTSTEQDIYLSYPQGDEIIHDPKIGFENLLIVGGNPIAELLANNLMPISIGAAIVIIGAIVVVKRR